MPPIADRNGVIAIASKKVLRFIRFARFFKANNLHLDLLAPSRWVGLMDDANDMGFSYLYDDRNPGFFIGNDPTKANVIIVLFPYYQRQYANCLLMDEVLIMDKTKD